MVQVHEFHPRLHLAHGLLDPGEQRAAEDAVPDVQFIQVRDRPDLGDVHVVDPVPRVHLEPELVGLHRAEA